MPTRSTLVSTSTPPSHIHGIALRVPILLPDVPLHFFDFVWIFEEATTIIRGLYAYEMEVPTHVHLTL
jgi:hypothetical protein